MLTTIERVLFLQEVPLLGSVPTEVLAHLAAVATEEDLAVGEELWRPGDPADSMFFVVEGELTLRDGDRLLAHAGANADLGATAMGLTDGLRNTTAVAARPTLLLRVAREDFYEVLSEHPELARALLLRRQDASP